MGDDSTTVHTVYLIGDSWCSSCVEGNNEVRRRSKGKREHTDIPSICCLTVWSADKAFGGE